MEEVDKQIASLDKQVAVLREGLAGVSKGILETGKSLEKALELQAASYDKQLVTLSDGYEKQAGRESLYVTREAWELQNSKIDDWRRSIDRLVWIAMGAGLIGGGLVAGIVRAAVK